MLVRDFDYQLPTHLIAQKPIANREDSRLLILDRKTGVIEHQQFKNISKYLQKDDVLVLNDTKVIPARLIGRKKTGAIIEILMIREEETDQWQCLIKPFRRLAEGDNIVFSKKLSALCIEKQTEGLALIKFSYQGSFYEILEELGNLPLPPYIKKKLAQNERYQTIYAKNRGSIAAPTAGLHFSEEILLNIKKKGVKIVYLTLHVGIGTFRPIVVENIKDHNMHAEFFSLNKENASILNKAIENKKRIIAVGTTVVRTLESIYDRHNKFIASSDYTNLFIYPGYEFKAISALVTNFHLPKSTLLLLVSAFASSEYIFKAYEEAIKNEYRFFSFGDAMLIK